MVIEIDFKRINVLGLFFNYFVAVFLVGHQWLVMWKSVLLTLELCEINNDFRTFILDGSSVNKKRNKLRNKQITIRTWA